MARPIVLSNGTLHVGLNIYGEVHDFYYPYVGLENHAASKQLRHKVGVYVDNQLSWFDDGSWTFRFRYHKNSLIGRLEATNEHLGIIVESDDFVDAEQNVFVRNLHVINTRDHDRNVTLYMHQVFAIGDGAGYGDTVQYLPGSQSILTYRGNRAFVIGGEQSSGKPFEQHSVGLFGIEGRAGTYMDAEDGQLANNSVEHGRVDSTIGFELNLPGKSSSRVYYWVAVGMSTKEAIDLHENIRSKKNALNRLLATNKWWQEWSAPAQNAAKKLDEEFRESFVQSVLLIKSNIDNAGAVIASTDTTMLHHSRDAYAYCWPRDGAYVVWPLIRLGYKKEPLSFFNFCKDGLHQGGYLLHKYQADGALGASWHGYEHAGGTYAPPIQLDETATVMFVFVQFFQIHSQDKTYADQLIKDYYEHFIKKMADFLSGYIDDKTGLPKACYDLWEEKFIASTYTTSVVYASLLAAADFAEAAKDELSAVRWRTAAQDIQENAHKLLYNADRKSFYKGLRPTKDGFEHDATVDGSAVFGAFMYELFPHDSEEITSSVATMLQQLSMPQEDVLGMARYEDDYYYRISKDIPGNPWFITALWFAQYSIEIGDVESALKRVRWCRDSMLETGVLPEQLNPFTKEFVSVAPLTWSQAEYASTLLDLLSDE